MSTNRNAKSDYQIGYRKPPVHTRFKPGTSGNQKGRPKRVPTLGEMVVDCVINKKIPVREGDRRRVVPAVEAILAKMLQQALQGDHRARSTILILMQAAERESASADGAAVSEQDTEIVRASLLRMASELQASGALDTHDAEPGENGSSSANRTAEPGDGSGNAS